MESPTLAKTFLVLISLNVTESHLLLIEQPGVHRKEAIAETMQVKSHHFPLRADINRLLEPRP